MRRLTGQGAIAAVAAVTALATACAPGSSDSKTTSKAPTSVSTDIAKAGNVTLTVWDQEVQGGQQQQIEKLNAQFQAKYPNVKIKRVSRSFSDLQKTLRLALSGNNPPDVVEANQGYASMAQFVKAGMLLPLDSYDKVYGWKQRYPKGLLDLNSVTADGKLIGSGNLYGVSINGEIVGLYYNKEKLTALGLQPPKTWAEFEQALATAKSKGEIPLAFGNVEKLPAMQVYGVVQDQQVSKDVVRQLVFGGGSGSWSDAANVAAAQKLADWAKQGYFTKDANAVKWDDTPVNFAKGQGVFMFGGTWWAPDLADKMKDKVGFMPPPPAQADAAPATMGGESLPWSITGKSKHADVAAAYINFITSPAAADVAVDTGNLPALRSTKQPATPLAQDVAKAWTAVSSADGVTPYIDYTTPTFTDTFGGELQKLIAGRASAQDVLQAAQKDYVAFQGQK